MRRTIIKSIMLALSGAALAATPAAAYKPPPPATLWATPAGGAEVELKSAPQCNDIAEPPQPSGGGPVASAAKCPDPLADAPRFAALSASVVSVRASMPLSTLTAELRTLSYGPLPPQPPQPRIAPTADGRWDLTLPDGLAGEVGLELTATTASGERSRHLAWIDARAPQPEMQPDTQPDPRPEERAAAVALARIARGARMVAVTVRPSADGRLVVALTAGGRRVTRAVSLRARAGRAVRVRVPVGRRAGERLAARGRLTVTLMPAGGGAAVTATAALPRAARVR